MGGAWERMIRSVRRILRGELHVTDNALSTLLCLVEGIIDNRPLTTVSNDPNDLELLTPNPLLMFTPRPLLLPGVYNQRDCYLRWRWRQVQYLADVFWRRWLREYLPQIQVSTKWRENKSSLPVGDVVLIVDYNVSRNQWLLGRVLDVSMAADGLVRSVQVSTAPQRPTLVIEKRPFIWLKSKITWWRWCLGIVSDSNLTLTTMWITYTKPPLETVSSREAKTFRCQFSCFRNCIQVVCQVCSKF